LKIRFFVIFIFIVFFCSPLLAQEYEDGDGEAKAPDEIDTGMVIDIVSVNDIKNLMSETFENIYDYVAEFEWINGEAHFYGTIQYKKPDKILLNFEEPQDQVIVSNGELLYIYIPSLKVVVQQSLSEDTESPLLTTTTEAGLTRLFDEYSFSFYDSSDVQPYGDTFAYHIKLTQQRPKVGFKNMDFWVSEKGLILQSNGTSPNGANISLIFSQIRTNTELPDYIFDFEVPADAQIIRNIIVPFADTQQRGIE
jgi:outer membrane lipoprotein-sorting protein